MRSRANLPGFRRILKTKNEVRYHRDIVMQAWHKRRFARLGALLGAICDRYAGETRSEVHFESKYLVVNKFT